MNKKQVLFFLVIIICGTGLITGLFLKKITTQYESTLTPLFGVFGLTTKKIDRALTRVIPIDSLDEKEFGEAIALRYESCIDIEDPLFRYLNEIIKNLTEQTKKPFDYRVFPVEYDEPNAFALPGGVICVTYGLLETLESEGELVAILCHEIGHIELSHCFDLIRFELLSKKTGGEILGQLVDRTIVLLARHSFNKTIENEADMYGYDLLLKTDYDPSSTASAFQKLQDYNNAHPYYEDIQGARVFRDYFMSHPPLKLRIEKFSEKANLWWTLHKDEKKYRGIKNLEEKRSFFSKYYPEEWVGYTDTVTELDSLLDE